MPCRTANHRPYRTCSKTRAYLSFGYVTILAVIPVSCKNCPALAKDVFAAILSVGFVTSSLAVGVALYGMTRYGSAFRKASLLSLGILGAWSCLFYIGLKTNSWQLAMVNAAEQQNAPESRSRAI